MLNDDIKRFWDNQAKEFGVSDLATAPDHAYRGLEIKAIIPHIRGQRILDVGCGNGYSTFEFAKSYPRKWFLGIDYSAKMIEQANTARVHNFPYVDFKVMDVRNLDGLGLYETIISERCLINLTSWDEQADAMLQMANKLGEGCRLIVVENFLDGLKNLNDLRKMFDLHEITVRWHNRYLNKHEFETFCLGNRLTIKYRANIGNLYYIISRVVYAALAKGEGQEPEYQNPINYIAAKLPNLGSYNFSPNMLYVLEKR